MRTRGVTKSGRLGVASVLLVAVALMMLALVPSTALVPPVTPSFGLTTFATGFSSPVFLTHAGDGSGYVYVVEQQGRIRAVDADGLYWEDPWLDVTDRVVCCGERGLLGLAFAPDFATSGTFFISYTGAGGTSTLERIVVSNPGSSIANVVSTEIIFTQAQPFSNHNGGMIAFGPDGMLYLGLGDGGSAHDPLNSGQDINTLLGALLRLDVSAPNGYAVPSDNPFVGADGRDEIWAYGLRNPWRFSFDSTTGDLWVADVGQNLEEEVNWVPASSTGGENYGWQIYEGNQVHDAGEASTEDRFTMTFPVATYPHGAGECSVTGGYVYRGAQASLMFDTYVYGDFCSGKIWSLTGVLGTFVNQQVLDTNHFISSFGEDEAGELYVVDIGGRIMRIVWTPGLL